MGCGPYLDNFGPNGVVFPHGSCNMGGYLLLGPEISSVVKNDLRWTVLDLTRSTCGSAVVDIMQTMEPKQRLIDKHECKHWLKQNLKTCGTRLYNTLLVFFLNYLISPVKRSSSSTPSAKQMYIRTTRSCLAKASTGATPLLSYRQVSLDFHWPAWQRDCNTSWRFSDLHSLCHYEKQTNDSEDSQLQWLTLQVF